MRASAVSLPVGTFMNVRLDIYAIEVSSVVRVVLNNLVTNVFLRMVCSRIEALVLFVFHNFGIGDLVEIL